MANSNSLFKEAHRKKEKKKAQELRSSMWWKNRIGEGICHYCNNKFTVKELTMDHVIPISKGGKSTRKNVVPCCKACNNQKKDYFPEEISFS